MSGRTGQGRPGRQAHPVAAAFLPDVVAQLRGVEERLAAALASREPSLDAWSRETLRAGGKRVRPLLLLTSFAACGGTRLGPAAQAQAIDAAAAIELVHTASLVHDDIMDEAAERRGQPSTYHAHGRDGAILVGDYLFTQAFALAAALPKAAMDMTADACRRLCEGQMREAALRAAAASAGGGAPAPDLREPYKAVIRDKTASLLAAACGIGASLAQAPDAVVQSLHHYGQSIGHAFQVLDDVLDVVGDPAWTGKAAGSDFAAGTLTSPYLNHVARGGRLPALRDASSFRGLRDQMLASGAVAESQLEASAYTQSALLDVRPLEPSPAKESLERLAQLLMERAA